MPKIIRLLENITHCSTYSNTNENHQYALPATIKFSEPLIEDRIINFEYNNVSI